MSQSEEVIQRRRQKILSRTTSANSEDEPQVNESSSRTNVFDRYKLLKEKEVNSRSLTFWSRFAGLMMLPLSFVLPPWEAYSIITLLFLFRAYIVTRVVESGRELDWLTGRFPLLGKLGHLDRIILMGKVVVNTMASFLMAAVIYNALWITYYGPSLEPNLEIPLQIPLQIPMQIPMQIPVENVEM